MSDTIHFVQQGKGGVGKSWAASQQVQHLNVRYGSALAIDTDPVNHSLARVGSLNAQPMEILSPISQNVDSRLFDQLVDWALCHPGPVVIDNDRRTLIHCVLVGGQAFTEAMASGQIDAMPRHRLGQVWNDIHGQLSTIDL